MIVGQNREAASQERSSQSIPFPVFSEFWARGFEWVLHPMRRWHLQGMAVSGLRDMQPYANLPWIFVANHPGNWDGFLLRALQKRLRPGAPIYSMMLSEELQRRPIFRRIGGIGLIPEQPVHNAKVLRMLRRLRQEQANFVLSVFPQGRLRPSWHRPLQFKDGVSAMAMAVSPAWIFPVAIHYENVMGLKPTAFLAMQKPILSAGSRVETSQLEMALGQGLDELTGKIATYGEKLPAYWTAPAMQGPDRECFSEWWPA